MPKKKQPISADLLREHLGSKATSVFRAFSCMGIAEEEIEAYKRKHPSDAAKANDAFRWLCPSALLRGKSDALYREHVRELIHRVARGQDPVELTYPEVLAVLSQQSLAAPLLSRWAALMTWLFAELKLGPVEVIPEPWEGSNLELLTELRREYNKRPEFNPRIAVAVQSG